MKSSELKSVVHDLLYLESDFNPMNYVPLKENLKLDLLSGQINYSGEDDFYKHYKKKAKWFANRIKSLNGKMEDFEEAELTALDHKESVKIKYNETELQGRIFFKQTGRNSFQIESWFSWQDEK